MDWTTLKYGSGTVKLSRNGRSGTLTFTVPVADMNSFVTWICRTSYPNDPDMWVSDVEYKGIGKVTGTGKAVDYTHYEVTANYSTLQRIDSAPVETWEFGAETLETGQGRLWKNAQTRCTESQGIIFPSLIRSITLVAAYIPGEAIMNTMGKVNAYWFQGFPPETLLFEGASTEQQYDYERNTYIYRITYKLTYRPVAHNLIWRAPMQATDELGAPATDSITGEPIYVPGVRGVAGWDRLIPNLYALADFNPIFFLPPVRTDRRGFVTNSVPSNPQEPAISIPWLRTK